MREKDNKPSLQHKHTINNLDELLESNIIVRDYNIKTENKEIQTQENDKKKLELN